MAWKCFFWHKYCKLYNVTEVYTFYTHNNLKLKVMKTIKTMMLAIAIVFGTSAFANVQSLSSENNTVVAINQANDDEYVDVKFEDLNEKVQTTIQGYTESYDVTALAYNAEKKFTRVTLTAKSDQSIKVVILDDEGKEYVEATAE